MSDFERFWRGNFPDAPPASFVLREVLGHRWVRFHSLPESKRYADNDEEHEIILRRANSLASRVIGGGSDCWVVASYPKSDMEVESYDFEIRTQFGLEESFLWRNPLEELEDQFDWAAYASKCVWQDSAFDNAISKVACGKEPSILWVSTESKAVFAPYDGGFDLILPDVDEVFLLSDQYSEWLSPHPDGL